VTIGTGRVRVVAGVVKERKDLTKQRIKNQHMMARYILITQSLNHSITHSITQSLIAYILYIHTIIYCISISNLIYLYYHYQFIGKFLPYNTTEEKYAIALWQ
jgi:hypothetical protein